MKRKDNLYHNIYKYSNIELAYNEVCRNTRNRTKVLRFREYKSVNITRVHDILKERRYKPGPYNRFIIKEPKIRKISSQGMIDKTINHLVSRFILYPAILPCLLDVNVASRQGLRYK